MADFYRMFSRPDVRAQVPYVHDLHAPEAASTMARPSRPTPEGMFMQAPLGPKVAASDYGASKFGQYPVRQNSMADMEMGASARRTNLRDRSAIVRELIDRRRAEAMEPAVVMRRPTGTLGTAALAGGALLGSDDEVPPPAQPRAVEYIPADEPSWGVPGASEAMGHDSYMEFLDAMDNPLGLPAKQSADDRPPPNAEMSFEAPVDPLDPADDPFAPGLGSAPPARRSLPPELGGFPTGVLRYLLTPPPGER